MNETPIRVEGVSKAYAVGFWLRRRVRALQELTLEVQGGEIFGLLGPNGAGKSTTIKILMDLVRPTSGEVEIFGLPPAEPAARAQIGYLPENPAPYEYLTPREFLTLSATLAGVEGREVRRRVSEVLERVELAAFERLRIRRFSKGMVQRVGLASALVGRPRLLVLDEPTSGLDPLGRRLFRDIILEERARGATVLLCTHIIPDVEALCDRVALLVAGRVAQSGSVGELLRSHGSATTEMVVEGLAPSAIQALTQQTLDMRELQGRVLLKCPDQIAPLLLRSLLDTPGRVTRVELGARSSLEDLFMKTLAESKAPRVGSEIQ
jgi:ABC-2 type transport system ATP-binding protein